NSRLRAAVDGRVLGDESAYDFTSSTTGVTLLTGNATRLRRSRLNKTQFIDAVAARLNADHKSTAAILDAILDEVYTNVSKGEKGRGPGQEDREQGRSPGQEDRYGRQGRTGSQDGGEEGARHQGAGDQGRDQAGAGQEGSLSPGALSVRRPR